MHRCLVVFILVCFAGSCLAQSDTTATHGTIKVAKPSSKIYVKAYYKMSSFTGEFSGPYSNQIFEPFPVVAGQHFPFNYSHFFREYFKDKKPELKKTKDTIRIELTVNKKGKATMKNKSMTGPNGTLFPNTPLQSASMHALSQIKKWFPAYYIKPSRSKFRGEVVIKPNKEVVDVTGTVTIIFSKEPFEEDEVYDTR